MSVLDALLVVAAGMGAGIVNTIVGSGTLITFPTLLFLGYPALTANVSNTIGLVAGGASGIYGYRAELSGQPLVRRLLPLSVLGSLGGAALLLVLPPAAFRAIVPALIALALVLVLVGPWLQAAAARRPRTQHGIPRRHAAALGAGVFVGGVYGGYFGAAQGVLLMGLFSALTSEALQRLNGLKNVLATAVNLVAAAAFLVFAREHVTWTVVGLIAVGSLLGGLVGARVGRRLAPAALRGVIVVVGVVALVKMVWFP